MAERNTQTASGETAAIPAHHLVLIAAAVAATCGDCTRILSIAPPEEENANVWGRSGRIAIHNSHRLPGRDGVGRLLTRQDPGASRT